MLVKAIGMLLQVREREVCRSVYVCKYIEAVPGIYLRRLTVTLGRVGRKSGTILSP